MSKFIGVRKAWAVLVACVVAGSVACSAVWADPVEHKSFGQTVDHQDVEQFTLTNGKGSTATFISYGATITGLSVPDKAGKMGDVVLGYDELKAYEFSGPSMGCVVGRFANRIAGASFTLDGTRYNLSANQGANTLHGGFRGLGKRVWTGEGAMTADGPAVRFKILDPDGAEGFPGNLHVTAIYTLTNDNTLKIEFLATTDKATPVNLNVHPFFNLGGDAKNDVQGYVTKIYASKYLAMDAGLIPTGMASVAGTPFDFTKAKLMGRDLQQLPWAPQPGYDHSLVLDNNPMNKGPAWFAPAQVNTPVLAAQVYDPASGRMLECWTTEPGLHLTDARNWGPLAGKNGVTYGPYRAFCLETQHFSDSPNHRDFPSTILRPGQTMKSLTMFKFTAPAKGMEVE